MGRKSLAEEYYEEVPEEEDREKGTWIVIYDFRGRKPNPRFWRNLKRLFALAGDGSMIQYSVLLIKRKRGAVAAVKIAKHYGAEVKVFKGEETEFTRMRA